MKERIIEWRHPEIDGAACTRCSETGRTLDEETPEKLILTRHIKLLRERFREDR